MVAVVGAAAVVVEPELGGGEFDELAWGEVDNEAIVAVAEDDVVGPGAEVESPESLGEIVVEIHDGDGVERGVSWCGKSDGDGVC